MKAPRTRLAQFIADKTLRSGASKRFSREIAAYLLTEQRTGELDSILRDVQHDWAEAGVVEVIASSAHPMTVRIRSDITREVKRVYPKARSVVITEQYDPEIIGGVRLNLPDRQLDLSVEAKLNKFKQLTMASTGRK
jgi:F0F1-type ATP synthase delta subunit